MIRALLRLYMLLLVVDWVLIYIPQLKATPAARTIRKIAGFTTDPVRKILPPDLPIDPSPLIVIILINILIAMW